MKAVMKSTSNGETSRRQSRAEFCGNAVQGVETCTESDRVVARTKCSVELGEEPSLLNGGHGPRVTNTRSIHEGIVRTSGRPENHVLQTRDVQ